MNRPKLILPVFIFCFTISLLANALENDSRDFSVDSPVFYLHEALNSLETKRDDAFFLAKQAEQMAILEESPDHLAGAYQLLGRLFFQEAAYNQSLDYFLKAKELWEINPNPTKRAEILNELGILYYYLNRADKAFEYHQEALEVYTSLQDQAGLASTYGYLGHYFEKSKEYDTALSFQQKAMVIYDQLQDARGMCLILENIGSIYEDLEQFDLALDYFQRAFALQQETNDEDIKIKLLNNLGDIYYKTNSFDKAFHYTSQAYQLAHQNKDHYQERSALRDLSQLFAASNDYEQAYAYLDSSVALYKKIYSEEGLRQVVRLETFFETEKKDREISLLEKDQHIGRLMNGLFGTGFSIVLLVGLIIGNRQRMRINKNKELLAAQEKIYETELQNIRLREQNLEAELAIKGRSLTTHTLHLVQKKQLFLELQEELNAISQTVTGNSKKQMKALAKKIDLSKTQDKEWEDFRKVFEQVHPSFFDKLRNINPDLSQADLKVASLMRMRLNSKDVSTMLGISTDSLRVARYRLRKKLMLEKDQKLGLFILSI